MKISIIDYGTGNIQSILRAFKKFNIDTNIVNKSHEIKNSTHLILPGVGALPKAMELLNKTNLIPDIKNHVLKERPILGICLGMQLLFSSSEEIEETQGLDFIKGKVIKLPEKETMEKNFKIPNVGWHTIKINDKIDHNSKYANLHNGRYYFVHSYYCDALNEEENLFYIKFNNKKICAVAQRNNIIGTQFHPEKSGVDGFKLIEKFIRI